jgi:serine protease Do
MVRRNGHWIVTLVGGVCLAFSAGLVAQKQQPAVSAAPTNGQAAQAVAEASQISQAFRHAAKTALPGMVSITTSGKVNMVRNQGSEGNIDPDELFENSPFGEFFKGNPQFREYFRRGGPGMRQLPMPRTHGMGSGFVIDPSGIILTASHVVADAQQVKVKLHDGREFAATEWKTDPRTDVAIVRIKTDSSLPVIKLGDSDSLEIGDWVLAIGSPFGLDATVTTGIISAKGRGPNITTREDFLQTDAAINPGNSGGPLVNLNGEVVGINTAISTRSGGYDGVGFAVPINLARWVADQLISKGEVSRAYLGIGIQPVSSDLAQQYNVPVGKGAVITQVMPDSPAAAAKLQPLDLVLQFNGKDVHGTNDLQGIVERMKAGATYPMQIVREGKEMTVNVQVREMPRDFAMSTQSLVPDDSAPKSSKSDSIPELGIDVESASSDMLRQLGYKEGVKGVVVNSVREDSPAAEVGLQAGMVIEMVGSKRVSTPAEFKDAIKGLSLEKGVLLLVRSPRSSVSTAIVVKGAAK